MFLPDFLNLQDYGRAPKRNLHRGPLIETDEVSYHRGAKGIIKVVKIKYQTMVDSSRFPLDPGKGEAARRLRQIAAGSLRAENGLVA